MKNFLNNPNWAVRQELQMQRSSFHAYKDQIFPEQKQLFRSLLFFAAVFSVIFMLMAFIFERVNGPKAAYVLSAIVTIIAIPATKNWEKNKNVILPTYVLCVLILALATSLRFTFEPGASLIIFAAAMGLLPVMVMDVMGRKCLFFFVIFVLHSIYISFGRTADSLSVIIGINLFVTSIGLLVSYWVQRFKLRYMMLYNEADGDKRLDFLTGLYNRLELFDLLRNRIAKRDFTIYAMYMIDIDNYKAYNDIYGHVAGDNVLRRVGAMFSEFGEKHKIRFYRYGGEEILGVGFDFDSDPEKIAKEINEAVVALNIPHRGTPYGVITVSVGYTTDTRRYEKMINKADKAMYKAKGRGKNQFACFEYDCDDDD